MAEQIHWSAKRGTRSALVFLSAKEGLKGNMTAFIEKLVLDHIDRQPTEIQNRQVVLVMKESYKKKKRS